MRYPTNSLPRRLGLYTQKVLTPVFKSRGLIEGKIITHWPLIVGEKFSNLSLPEKITFPKGKKNEGILHLQVTSSGALLLHAIQDLILEKVNTFFGYKALVKLRLTHGLIPLDTPPVKEKADLPPEALTWLEEQTQTVEDPNLRNCLKNLGISLLEETTTSEPYSPS